MWKEKGLRLATEQVLKTQNPRDVKSFAEPNISSFSEALSEGGGVVSFGSTQPKKMKDANIVFRAERADLKVIRPETILSWFLSAEEASLTFTGNAYEKVEALLDRVYKTLGYDKYIVGLKEHGIDPEKFVFLVNDNGSYLNQDYSGEPEFEISKHEVGLEIWPGVETGPINDAHGGTRLYLSLIHI